jgi:hypothetical protein
MSQFNANALNQASQFNKGAQNQFDMTDKAATITATRLLRETSKKISHSI